MPTQEGDAYIYIGVDAYSEFLFDLGVSDSNSDDEVLKHIRMLTLNKDFNRHSGMPFTLVLHKYEHLADEINSIIKPLGGTFIINDAFLTVVLTPVLEHMYKGFSQMPE